MSILQREDAIYEAIATLLQEQQWSEERIALALGRVNREVSEMANIDVETLESLIKQCRFCYGKKLVTENGPVPGRGARIDADILFIGVMPGATEEKTGQVFTGPNSKILTDSCKELGIGTPQCPIYAHNVVCCMPVGKTPKAAQVHGCEPFLAELLVVMNPNIVVTLGVTALSCLLGKTVKLEDFERQVLMQGRYLIVPLKHPSALHRIEEPEKQRAAFAQYKEDLAGIKRMNDRIKKLQAEGSIPKKGEFNALFCGEEDIRDDNSGSSEVQQHLC